MTSASKAKVYLSEPEVDLVGNYLGREVAVFMPSEEAQLVLCALNDAQQDSGCQSPDCEACEKISQLWYSIFFALPFMDQRKVRDAIDAVGKELPFHRAHNPR